MREPPTTPAERRRARRRAADRAGRAAERIAALYLRLKGYRILERRFLAQGGEIDIVAARGDTIVFVEVKLRAALDDARTSIAPQKRRRIARAARVFLSRRDVTGGKSSLGKSILGKTIRADAIYCARWRWPVHVEAAFHLDID